MQYLPCYLWVVLLVAAILCFIFWCTLPRPIRHHGKTASMDGTDVHGAPPILWLTPACSAALGNCAEPEILQNASARKIASLLAQAHYPPEEHPPELKHYQTWPEQAAMLASGRYEALRNWQKPWLAQHPSSPSDSGKAGDGMTLASRDYPRFGPDGWLILSLLMLVAALVSGLLILDSKICTCRSNAIFPPSVAKLELSADAIFDYKLRETHHPRLLQRQLEDLFQSYDGIQIISIEGHTDPIGSTEDNEKLGKDRAEIVLNAIRLIHKAKPWQFGQHPFPAGIEGGGPSKDVEDSNVWRECFERFQLKIAEDRFRPLRNLSRSENLDGRPSCMTGNADVDANTKYPACASPYDEDIPRDLKIYAKKAENFRKITECLSPMRHVIVRIRYGRRVPTTH